MGAGKPRVSPRPSALSCGSWARRRVYKPSCDREGKISLGQRLKITEDARSLETRHTHAYWAPSSIKWELQKQRRILLASILGCLRGAWSTRVLHLSCGIPTWFTSRSRELCYYNQ